MKQTLEFFKQWSMIPIAMAIGIVALSFVMSGCETAQQMDPAAYQQAVAESASSIGRAEAELAKIPVGTAKYEQAAKAVEAAKVVQAIAEAGQTEDGDIDVERAARTGVGFLPPPFNVIGLLGLGFAAPAWKAWRNRRRAEEANAAATRAEEAASSLARSIEKLKQIRPEVAAAMKLPDVAAYMNSIQTPAASDIVDGVQSNSVGRVLLEKLERPAPVASAA